MARPVSAIPCAEVKVTSKTWSRDSHELFDFEAHHLHSHSFTVARSMICARNGTEVSMITEPAQVPQGAEVLLRIVKREGSFWIDRANPSSSSSKKLWIVVRELPGAGHRLGEGDVMKLGRFKFRVRQLVANSSEHQQPELRLDESGATCHGNPQIEGRDLSQTLCRICLLEGPSEDDPLIAPCKCKGSIEYVHLGCLRHWIRGRLNLSDGPHGSYFYRPLTCELCKSVYPTYVSNEGETKPLVEVPFTQAPFIVLENMIRDSQQHATRGLHVISLAEKILKLGRGHESDVRIADVSISRCHATIRFNGGQFMLEDNNSKFGTLVAMKKSRVLEANVPISIQMGRSVLTLHALPADATSLKEKELQVKNNPEDERAWRLSLLTRGISPGSVTSTGSHGSAMAEAQQAFRQGTEAAQAQQARLATLETFRQGAEAAQVAQAAQAQQAQQGQQGNLVPAPWLPGGGDGIGGGGGFGDPANADDGEGN